MNILLLICFFVSGFGSLIYETLWTRHITHVIGGSPYAVSIILTVFMGGLGLGGALGGRLADRLSAPAKLLRAYGILEIAIGAYALALPSLLSLFRPLFSAIYVRWYGAPFLYNGLVFALCAALLLLPVLCMGATLPLLGRYCVRGSDKVGGPLSLLYSINTLGAAAGVLAAGFWLFPSLGLKAATLIAAVLNAAVGAACAALAGKASRAEGAGVKSAVASAAAGNGPSRAARGTAKVTHDSDSIPWGFQGALAVFAVSGYCAMAYEVAWTKVLTLLMGPTTYAFTLVLAVFITGLAAGGWAFGRLADRARNPAWMLAATQAAAALTALFAGHRMGNSLFLFQKIDFQFADRFGPALAAKSLVLFAFMIAPTFFLGAAFPLAMRLAAGAKSAVAKGASAPGNLGRAIGTAYAVNTCGGVLGAWSAGFLLIPGLGSERSLGLLAAIQAIAAALLAFPALRGRGEGAWRWAASLGTAALVLGLCAAYPGWDRAALGRAANRILGPESAAVSWTDAFLGRHPVPPALMPERQEFYGDGIGGFTSVWRTRNLVGSDEYGLFVSGKADASSRLDMFTQVLLSQFPMALHPHPKKVMVLGLASGVTAGEALAYDIDRLDVLEINPQVRAASGFFERWNGKVLEDPRTRFILQDAKAHLLLSKEKYDVIVSEPSNPWMAGLGELFTREFFERARDRLEDGGILVEFLHSYQMDWDVFSLVGRTFAQVFPDGMLVRTMPDDRRLPGSSSDYLLVGVKGGGRPRFLDTPEKRAALARSKNLRLSDPRLFYRMVETEDLAGLFGAGPINTDDLPLLEFRAPKLRFTMDSRAIEGAIAAKASLSPATLALRDSLRADPAERLDFAEYALSVSKPFPGMMDWAAADTAMRARFAKSLERYCEEVHVVDWDFLDDEEMRTRCSVHQMGALNRNLKNGGSAAVYLAMGEVCMVNRVPANAFKFYGKALESAGEGSSVGREARARMEAIRAAFSGGADAGAPGAAP
jgi:spermidine synthase